MMTNFTIYVQHQWRKEMFYFTTHSTHFIYGYMASDIWLRTILIVRKETRCRHIGYSFWLTARVLLYAPSHGQDSTYHGLCYTSREALAGTRNSSMGSPHEGLKARQLSVLPLSKSDNLVITRQCFETTAENPPKTDEEKKETDRQYEKETKYMWKYGWLNAKSGKKRLWLINDC